MLITDGLMEHQAQGAQWLLDNPKGMLAWEMGVGKTATALRAWEASQDQGPLLVLCLASARENWRREALRFRMDPDLPPKVQVLKTTRDRIDPTTDIVVVNYDKLLTPAIIKQLRARGRERRWGAIIADEAHVLKTPTAERTRLVYGGGHHLQEPLLRFSDRFWPLTGTPMPNHPAELWTHAYHLWPEAIHYRGGKPMELWEFELGFCTIRQAEHGYVICGGKNLEELKQRLGPHMNRLKRKDVLSLPQLRIDSWPLDSESTSGTGRLPNVPELMEKLSSYGNNPEAFNASTLDLYLTCIQSACSNLATLRRETGVLKAVAGVILLQEELENGGPKTVVFAHHRDAIDVLAKGLRAFKPAILHGGTPHARRDEEIDRFQSDPSCRVFIGQIEAAGSSINLQAAENVVFVEASWSPGDNDQALSRVYRNGQTRPVLVRFAYLKGSIDEAVNRALARKAAMIAQVIE